MRKKIVGWLMALGLTVTVGGFAACGEEEKQQSWLQSVPTSQEESSSEIVEENSSEQIESSSILIENSSSEDSSEEESSSAEDSSLPKDSSEEDSSSPEDSPPEKTPTEGVLYTLSADGTYYIVSGMDRAIVTGTDIVIASVYNDLPVQKIGEEAFEGYTSLTSVIIPDSVTSIGASAFSECSKLASVVIGDGVTSIESGAFALCDDLENVVIGDSVTSVGANAFYRCWGLQYNEADNGLYLGNAKNPYHALIKAKDTSITSCTIRPTTKVIASSAFSGCSSLTSVVLPDSVAGVGYWAFSGCNSLQYNEYENGLYLGNANNLYHALIQAKDPSITNCTLHTNTKVVADFTFMYCSDLTSVVIPDGVTNIGFAAFGGCSNLTSVVIPDSVTSIGNSAFSRCNSLTNITFEGTVEQWNKMEKGILWNDEVPATEVVCSDGNASI